MFSKLGFTMKIIWILLLAGLYLPTVLADIDETSVAVTFSEIAGVRGGGVIAATPFESGIIKGNASTTAQAGGGIIRGKYHAEAGIAYNGFDFVVYTDGMYKGYSLSGLGRQADVGLAVEAPESDIGGFHVTGGAGVFGRNAGAFGPPNARDDLERLGYDPNVLDGKGLEGLNPPPSGLSFKAGNSLNLLLYAEAMHPKGFGAKVKLMPELAGEGDVAVHQLIISPMASYELGERVSLEVSIDVGVQRYGDEIESELATLAALKLSL